ncbi:MAG TPA: mechanosensitive ion channel family protein [Polyangiaceae bacterium]
MKVFRQLCQLLFVLAVSVASVDHAAAASPAALGKPVLGSERSAAAPAEETVAPDSPRAAFIDFRRLTHRGDFASAARYLDLSSVDQSDGPDLAQHLREVLDRHLALDPEKLSPASHGSPEDGVAPDKQLLGSVPGATGQPEQVLMQRKSYRPNTHWLFSADTVAHIESWYDHLGNVWLIEHMPQPLQHMGPYHIRRWQWLALGPLVLGGWLLGFAVTRLTRAAVHSLFKRDPERLSKLRGPAALAVAVAVWYAGLPSLGLYEQADDQVRRWFSAGLILAMFWAAWRTVELSQRSVGASRWARQSLSAHSLLLLGARLAKFAVAAIAFTVVLAELGYHATTIITGLGIGGVALALAAQKTVENLFGAFSLAIDQPFREGDTITVDSVSGTVEAIGLRSTRIRTADRTVVSIPNGKLAEMRVETVNRQDRLRFYCVVGVAHATSNQLSAVLSALEGLLRAEQLVEPATVGARLIALTDAGMNLEVTAMLATTDGNAFAAARQALLLGIVQAIEKAGARCRTPRAACS